MIATSEVKVSCLVRSDQAKKALRTAAQVFELDENQIHHNPIQSDDQQPEVRGVALDQEQSQLTVTHVPDKPGSAAALCRGFAEANISLDTIVQSERLRHSNQGVCRDISFTLPTQEVNKAIEVLKPLLEVWPGALLKKGPAIARVSAVGAGMPTRPGTAAKMFKALAKAGINIEMIATSEIRVSCVVRNEDAITALQAVHSEFDLGGSIEHKAEGSESPV